MWIEELEAENAALKEHVADHQLLFKDYAAAQHRIKQLREACEAALSDDQPYIDKCKAALATPDSTAELDAVMKDAERYRWLRDNYLPLRWMKSHEQPDGGWVFFKLWTLGNYWKWADTKDAAIDAAIQGGSGEPR
jgi:hypothetical protein